MMGASAFSQTSAPTGQDGLAPTRVILVGRTGLDGMLRGTPSLELCRAASTSDGVCEAVLAAREGARDVVAVIAGDAFPWQDDVRRHGLIRAMRKSLPGMRLYVQTTGNTTGTEDWLNTRMPGVDDWLTPAHSATHVLGLIRGAAQRSAPTTPSPLPAARPRTDPAARNLRPVPSDASHPEPAPPSMGAAAASAPAPAPEPRVRNAHAAPGTTPLPAAPLHAWRSETAGLSPPASASQPPTPSVPVTSPASPLISVSPLPAHPQARPTPAGSNAGEHASGQTQRDSHGAGVNVAAMAPPSTTGPAGINVPFAHAPGGTTIGPGGAAQSSSAGAITPSSLGAGDESLVARLLHGDDPLPAALELIRARTGDTTVSFSAPHNPLAGTGAGGVPAFHGTQCPVSSEEGTYGTLRSTRLPAARLAEQARWLGAWLRLRDQHAMLREAAFTDPLTGAWNRRSFDRSVAHAIAQARELRRFVTVLLFDIDNFKSYNDRFGHEAGDEILVQTVELLRSTIRPTDKVCRLGGDEFAVIFDEPQGPRHEGSRHPTSAHELAHRFRIQLLSHKFPKLTDLAPGTLTISAGLATFPWDGQTPAQLLSHADKLLLESKRQGKNAIRLGPGSMER